MVTADIDLHGVTVPHGAKMGLRVGAANRDERRFGQADTFDVRRTNNDHLSFGYGIHFCIGAALIRAEARIGLEELLRRTESWEVDEERAQMAHHSTVRGWTSVPVTAS